MARIFKSSDYHSSSDYNDSSDYHNSNDLDYSRQNRNREWNGEGRDPNAGPQYNSNPNRNGTNIFLYVLAVMLIMILLNAFMFPAVNQQTVQDVSYSEFLSMVDNDQVKTVALDSSQNKIQFQTDNTSIIYETGAFPDDQLINRLQSHGVNFQSEIQSQTSPLIAILLSWVLPIIIFVVIGWMLSRSMTKAGDNVMSFGKSNAKIVAETDVKTTFADVAG